ncbi:hypothetical protein [Holdemanella porci]|jgi:lysophospholipase L1-like esterase|uniref:hypothetical protein n=1 Tax=Holdemanella porci TaxID=2652276 RepID=UPI0022E274E4|nr:hypothetical protein [Holdemanella porci]
MKILFFGDSNTWGYDAIDASRQPNRFTQLVKKAFRNMKLLRKAYVVEHCAWMIRMMKIVMELK